eukprot:6195438-Pleurochrysis_carterae.AAC.1
MNEKKREKDRERLWGRNRRRFTSSRSTFCQLDSKKKVSPTQRREMEYDSGHTSEGNAATTA